MRTSSGPFKKWNTNGFLAQWTRATGSYPVGCGFNSHRTHHMKECSVCHHSDVEFYKNSSKRDGLQSICKGCKKIKDAEYFQDTKGHHKSLNKERKRQTRQWVWDYLETHPCIDCGETDPIVLEFDHRSDKISGIADMVSWGYTIPKIEKEIAKCDVRCANCHRRKTAKDLDWYKDLDMGL